MATGQDLFSRAMRTANVLAAGETADATEIANVQLICNGMLESWGAEDLDVFTLTRNTFSFVATQQAYTLGTGGNFNMARPPKIEYVSYIYNANPAQPLERRIKMYSDAEWADIPVKAVQNVLPEGVYDDGGFPFRTLSYWPIPTDSSVQTVIGSWTPLTQFSDLTTDVTFPPGYYDAIVYNLAVRIAAEWPGEVSQLTIDLAAKSLGRIKALNVQPIKSTIDPLFSSDGEGGRYDWRVDDYR